MTVLKLLSWKVPIRLDNNQPRRQPMSKNIVGYEGKKVKVGIDVHKRTYVITARCDGTVVKRASVPANPTTLAESLKRWFKGAEIFSCYEAGFSGFGLHRILVASGIHNIVINPASIEIAASDKKKTDKRDSNKMAEQLDAGRLKGIYIPTEEEELNRQLTRTREQLVRERTRVANQIKSKLFYFGKIGANDKRTITEKYLKDLETESLPETLKLCLGALIELWRFLAKKISDLQIDLCAQSFEDAENEVVYRSVPGVGIVSARILSNELGNLAKRFSSQKAIFQFTGLTPSESSSGDKERKGNIDRQGSARIRCILTEVSWRAIKQDGALRECFERIASTRGGKRAIVAIARKLIGRIRACFVHQQLYVVGLCE